MDSPSAPVEAARHSGGGGGGGRAARPLRDGEDERAAAARAGRVKLGVELRIGRKIGEKTADRGDHVLRLADYEATVVSGTPSVPQAGRSVTQYDACMFTDDPRLLAEAAGKGSLCARVFLEEPARQGRAWGPCPPILRGTPRSGRGALLPAVWAYSAAAGPLVGRAWPIRYRDEEDG